MDSERIKRRIRALLNLAEGDGAADGEIENAMRMAAELMDAHHLEAADCAAGPVEDRAAPPEMGMADSIALGANHSRWEGSVAWAIMTLVGSVGCYKANVSVPEGIFGKPSHRSAWRFFGESEDAQLAAELLTEWVRTISTMAVGKYGGCLKGDGAQYAYGFAQQLAQKAREAEAARKEIVTDSTRALVHVGRAGSLADVLAHKRTEAREWLAKTTGCRLRSRGGGGRGYSGSHDAYAAGRADGARADFTATRRRKLA